MSDAFIVVGGETVAIPVLSFGQLRKVIKLVPKYREAEDNLERAAVAMEMIAIALAASRPDLDMRGLEEKMIGDEYLTLFPALTALMAASGLVPSGEAPPPTS